MRIWCAGLEITKPRKSIEMGRLNPFFSYYGGKWRIAKRYPPPQHKMVIEPFAGSAGYSVTYADREVVLCDLNEKVCGTWDYLINVSESEVRAIPVDFDHVEDLSIPQEARWLVGWWLAKGRSSPATSRSAWARDTRYKDRFWGQKIRERIASQVPRIRHWHIFQGSYEDLGNWEDGATWFVDPPYNNQAGRYYTQGPSGVDYKHLAEWCRAREGQVMVCENEGAEWLPFTPFCSTAGVSRSSSKEAIWIK